MKISSISDVHLSSVHPERFQLFYNFCHSKEVSNSDIVILLGDIFDVMTGNKKQYYKKYSEYFKALSMLLDQGKKLLVVEGNHDFHTEKIYSTYFLKNNPSNYHLYEHIKLDKILEADGKKIYIGHGDILDYKNEAYKKWKKIYSSKFFKFLVCYFLPFWFIEFLGKRASMNSKKRSRNYFDPERYRTLYRDGFIELIKSYNVDIAITGHTHIEEHEVIEQKTLLNNGFFPTSKKFIHIDNGKTNLITLEES